MYLCTPTIIYLVFSLIGCILLKQYTTILFHLFWAFVVQVICIKISGALAWFMLFAPLLYGVYTVAQNVSKITSAAKH